MKKLLTFYTPVILILLFIGFQSTAQRRLHKKMIGTWQMCNEDSTIITNYYDGGFIVYKTITNNTFMYADIQKKHKTVHNTFWGTYSLKKNVYTEFIEYTSSGYHHNLGERNYFEIRIKDDLMFIKGINNDYTSIWKKVKGGNP